jgi:hypothetical protein
MIHDERDKIDINKRLTNNGNYDSAVSPLRKINQAISRVVFFKKKLTFFQIIDRIADWEKW